MKSVTCAVIGAGSVVRVDIDEGKKVAHLKNAIKKMLPSIVQCDAPDLTLYVAKKGGNWLNWSNPDVPKLENGELPDEIYAIMATKGNKMDPNCRLSNVAFDFPDNDGGGDGDLHILVAVPGHEIRAPAKKPPHPARKRRWDMLNEIIERNKTTTKSYEEWLADKYAKTPLPFNEIVRVMPAVRYDLARKPIPDDKIDALHSYLLVALKSFGMFATLEKSTRPFLVGPVLACVCALFDEDTTLLVGETVDGRRVRGTETFEFVIQRGGTRVCVVEAREGHGDGLVHAYVGSEVLAEVEGLSTVYSIVATLTDWRISKITDETVERDDASMVLVHGVPTRDSVKEVAEKIYAMLSNDV